MAANEQLGKPEPRTVAYPVGFLEAADWSQAHPLAAVAVVSLGLLASLALPVGDSLALSCLQSAVFALWMLVFLRAALPQALQRGQSLGWGGLVAAVAAVLAAVPPLTAQIEAGQLPALPEDGATLAWRLVLLALVAALTAIAEEALFRGVLLKACSQALAGNGRKPGTRAVMLAAAASSLCFACAHGAPFTTAEEPAAAIAALRFAQIWLFGMVMCALACAAKSLRASIACHALFDLFALAPLALSQGIVAPFQVVDSPSFPVELALSTVLLAGALVVALCSARVHSVSEGTQRG